MRLVLRTGLLMSAVAAVSVALAPSASAFSSNPLFNPVNNQQVTAEGGKTLVVSKNLEVECEKTVASGGIISTSLLMSNLTNRYLKCVAVKGEEVNGCPVNSVGAGAGSRLIVINTVHAILGLLLPSGETGVLFLPQSGTVFTTFAEAKKEGKLCIPESKVTGTVGGLIAFVGEKGLHGNIKTPPSGTAIDLTHGLGPATSKLVAFGNTSNLTQEDENTFSEETEVT